MYRFSRYRAATAIYFIWLFIHIGLLLYADKNADSSVFWPFIDKDKTLYNTYDIFEFFIYAGAPLVLFGCYRILFPGSDEVESLVHHKHSSYSFFLPFLDEKIRAEELTQKINELTNQPINYSYLEELKKDRLKAGSRGTNGWLEKREVKKKYRKYESNQQDNKSSFA